MELDTRDDMVSYSLGRGREECKCTGGVLMSRQRWGSLDEKKGELGEVEGCIFLVHQARRNENENG